MAKSRRNSSPAKRKPDARRPEPAQRARIAWDQLDDAEQMSIVCRLFFGGLGASQVAKTISERYATHFSREATHRLLQRAHKLRWFDYRPPLQFEIGAELSERYTWLRRARVVHTSRFEDVAGRAAELLIELLQDVRKKGRNKIHIGFAGGHAIRVLAQILSDGIRLHRKTLPETIVVHALVAGFDVFEPTTDPNTFFTLFQTSDSDDILFEHVGLHTPPVVTWGEIRRMRTREGIKESYQCAKDIDVIVTSGSCWDDKHSILRKYMGKARKSFQQLESADCVGDMLWLPLSRKGPLEAGTQRRAMTLLDLSDLRAFIEQGKYVLLALGPCSRCGCPKGKVLEAILDHRLITDLVVDSCTARQVLEAEGEAGS